MGAASDQQRSANAETLDYYVANSLPLPAGTIEVDASGGAIQVPTARTITGDPLGTVLDVYPKAPTSGWLLFDSVAQGGVMELRDLTIHGPTSIPDGYTESVLRNTDIFRWIGSGTLVVDNLTVTGLPARAVQFSGVGDCTIANSTLNGYVAPVARWESFDSPTPGSLTVSNSTLTGVGSGSTSIGIYVHPHIPVTVTDCTFEDFARYGVYQNGTMAGVADALIEDSTFQGCAVIKSAESATATIRRIAATGTDSGQGSVISGHLVIEDSHLASTWRPWSTLMGADHRTVTFRRCTWDDDQYLNFSSGTDLAIVFEDCTWNVTRWNATVLSMDANASGAVTFTRCTINDAGTSGDGIRILGAVTLDRRGLTLHSSRPFWNLGPSVAVID